MPDIVDIRAPAAPGSLMRAVKLDHAGRFRLARRSCELYSVQIVSAGAWGRIRAYDGKRNEKFLQPSTFTGSFWLSVGCEGELIVELAAQDVAPNLTINWREPDREMV